MAAVRGLQQLAEVVHGPPHALGDVHLRAPAQPQPSLGFLGAGLPADVEPWMLDTTAWPGTVDDYVDALVWLVGELLTDPKHFFRSFTVKELGRLMAARPTRPVVRAHPGRATGQHPPDLPPEREAIGVVAIGIELVDPRPA